MYLSQHSIPCANECVSNAMSVSNKVRVPTWLNAQALAAIGEAEHHHQADSGAPSLATSSLQILCPHYYASTR